MKRIAILTLFLCFLGISTTTAQGTGTPQLYEGSIDGKLLITMYLVAKDNACGGDVDYQGIYRYNKSSIDNWLLLDIDHNAAGQFVMVEVGLSGILLLQKNAEGFSGVWLHPNGVTRKKVMLKKKKMTDAQIKQHDQFLDDTNYRYYDC